MSLVYKIYCGVIAMGAGPGLASCFVWDALAFFGVRPDSDYVLFFPIILLFPVWLLTVLAVNARLIAERKWSVRRLWNDPPRWFKVALPYFIAFTVGSSGAHFLCHAVFSPNTENDLSSIGGALGFISVFYIVALGIALDGMKWGLPPYDL